MDRLFRHIPRSSANLVLTSWASSALGYLFWLVVARLSTPYDLGMATTYISVLTFCGLVSTLGLNQSMMRLYGRTNTIADRQALASLAIRYVLSGAGLTSACAFVIMCLWLYPNLGADQVVFFLALSFCVVTLFSVNQIVDGMLISTNKSGIVLYRYVILGLVRVPFVVIGWYILGWFSVGLSYFLGLLLALVMTTRHIETSILPRMATKKEALDSRIFRLSVSNSAVDIMVISPSLVFPPLLQVWLGPQYSGYFYITWFIAYLIYSIPSSSGQSFLASRRSETNIAAALRSSVKFQSIALGPVSLIFFVFAGHILFLFGSEYSEQASTLFRLMIIAAFPLSMNLTLIYLCRLTGNTIEMTLHASMIFAVTLILLVVTIPIYGLTGAGMAWLLANSATSIYAVYRIRGVLNGKQEPVVHPPPTWRL